MLGIFGGSGFYKFLDNVKETEVETSFGKPSDKIFIGEYKGKEIAFLPRHGREHRIPPHRIPYKANIAAFKKLGVRHIIAPCASGSLRPEIKPGDFVVCNQFVNFTRGRDDTFFHGDKDSLSQKVAHISSAEPYCFYLGNLIFNSCQDLNIRACKEKTVVVINGPRFSTKAESRFFSNQGWGVINMTQYPEAVLAREAEICYAAVALITDYDAGLDGNPCVKPVTFEEVIKVFNGNNEKIKKVIFDVAEKIDENRVCACHAALKEAVVN